MRYDDFYVLANQWIQNATEENRKKYGMDIIHRLYQKSEPYIKEELYEDEFKLFQIIFSHIEDGNISLAINALHNLELSMAEDEVRAIEFNANLDDLVIATNNWLYYRQNGSLEALGNLAANITDSVDRDVDGDWESEAMHAEIERQRRILHGEEL